MIGPLASSVSHYTNLCASELIRNMTPKIMDASNEDIRRLKAASLADAVSIDGRTPRKFVQDSTKNLSSKETGFIAYVLDALKGLFDQEREDRSQKEIRASLIEIIPTLNIPLSSETMFNEKHCGSFPLATLTDKAGAEYRVTLWVDKEYSLESLRIFTSSSPNESHLYQQIPLTGPESDKEIWDLIHDNPNILPEKKIIF
jgi:hypothetical protein